MSPSALNGDETVGSGGPRQKGKATADTLKYVIFFISD
jgi:histone acetyltransferase HTATIP